MTLAKLSLLPRAIAGQIVLLVALSAIIFHLCITAAFFIGHHYFERQHPPFGSAGHHDWERNHVSRAIDDGLSLSPPQQGVSAFNSSAALAAPFSGSAPAFQQGRPPEPPPFGTPGPPPMGAPPMGPPPHDILPMIIATIVFVAISFTIFLIWAVVAVTRPLRNFAQAVDAFSAEGPIAPLAETGPQELCVAAHALNRMHERVTLMVEQRTEMLAAIGHDLRTPVTRLRLRAEFIEPPDLRDAMIRDLEQMNAMIHSALSFIRDGIDAQRNVLLDLGALLQTIRDEFVDMGHNVHLQAAAPAYIKGSAEELHRALSNLVSNGVKFGQTVEISMRRSEADQIEIDIRDDGPGIPAESREAMFAPFARGDNARGSEPLQGFGLGLPISRAIVNAHHGSLELLERSPHGVIARVTLAA